MRGVVYSSTAVETALCVFEWMMDHQDKAPWKEFFDDQGWAQMRLSAMDTALWIEQVLAPLDLGAVDAAHDWEIVPFLMLGLDPDKWIEGTAYGVGDPFPDIEATRAELIRQFDCASAVTRKWFTVLIRGMATGELKIEATSGDEAKAIAQRKIQMISADDVPGLAVDNWEVEHVE